MKKFILFLLILGAGSILFTNCQSDTSDADIQQHINDLFKKDMAGAALNATVDSGVATITGQCDGVGCTTMVIEKVKKLKGVKDVHTHIIEK